MLALKIIGCLIIAFILGGIAGYLLGRIRKCENQTPKPKNTKPQAKQKQPSKSVGKVDQPRSRESREPSRSNSAITNRRAEREREMQEEAKRRRKEFTTTPQVDMESKKESPKKEVGVKPDFLEAPQGERDELKKISGIGPKIERTLNNLGIFHYRQIAELSEENIAWLDDHLSFRGRINRDRWVEQAKVLAVGQETEFSKRFHS